jgi:mono/diheme cytochrome c family protein
MALEQPSLSLSAPGLLSDPNYLDRYGFIPSDPDLRLPVGFAHGGPMLSANGTPLQNPATKRAFTSVGLTCAACHTGRFTYRSTSVVIDGGPALIDLNKFENGVVLSLLYTRWVPFRFNRFADRVLGVGASKEAKSNLKSQLDDVIAQFKAIGKLEKKVESQTVDEGYGRLDALNRIGNTVFAIDLLSSPDFNADNFVGFSAPVHYPRIWNASWLQWVQYNGSIQQPMTRNAGEALGVLAQVNLTGNKKDLYSSTVRIDQLYAIEKILAGKPPTDAPLGFKGLTSPEWPELLPRINSDRAARGAALYKQLCEGCHMAPVTDAQFWASNRWSTTNAAGERYLNLEQIDVNRIGTDPAQAEDMSNRRIATPSSLELKTDQFGVALGRVVENTVNHWYNTQPLPTPAALRDEMNGNRSMDVRAPLSYKVRPLNGIWATPPYLHNGSVPTLFALLSPVSERPKKFYLGNREYDPVNVGYRIDALPKGFEFDTTKRGNSNSGHEFVSGSKDIGVIGRYLSPDERLALIEYLKTL